jgi:hypothetical protein
MAQRNTCAVNVGRLLEIDLAAGYRSVSDVDQMTAMTARQIDQIPEPTRVVIAADWRACRVMTPVVSDRVVDMLERSNPRVERSAILHGVGHATSVLQLARLTREAHLEVRRIFTDPEDMETWLAEVLTSEERARVHALLFKAAV